MNINQKNKLKKIILENSYYSFSEYTYTNQLKMKEDLGLDSLDLLELVIIVEKEFNIVFSSVEIENLKTIEELELLITKKLN
jgi:acyl carrier protein